MTAAPATDPFVTATTENGVLWLTLNRPQRRNPLSTEMIAALSQSIAAGNQDPAVKVMVIAGSGPAFSAGHDLAEIQRRADEEHTAWQARVQQLLAACAALMNSILHSPKAIIASVQGIASAAGCQLVSACDLAIASDEATFCTPGVNIGVFCTTPLVGIGRNLSRKHALEMATSSLAEKIASRSPESIARGKSTFYRQVEMPLDEAFALANQVMLDNLTSEGDAKEGVDAFFGKRTPQWGE